MEEINCNVGKEVCGANVYLRVTLEPHFKQLFKEYLHTDKGLISINYLESTEWSIGGIFLPSKYFLTARKHNVERVATTT